MITPEAVEDVAEVIGQALITRQSTQYAASAALVAAEPHILAPVYTWLAEVLGYPFDMTTDDKPPWLDVDRLAEAWARKDGETVEIYRDAILSETGWADAGPLCDECGLIVCICAGGGQDA